ncbi:MAG TPA: penicillin acylase family protein [Mycobacteriales bacterium]|nr:penicillin acylase family protein [Mycobacteriales bacterium]
MPRSVAFRAAIAVLATGALAITAAGVAPASSASPTTHFALPSMAYRAHDYAHGQAMSILPPGENGTATQSELLKYAINGTRPPHSQDQLGKYEKLLYGYSKLTDGTLGKYYDDESFGVPKKDVLRKEEPSATGYPKGSVVIVRDQHDVPHIYGATNEDGAFGAGYAQAQDRLFLMDVLRHYGAGDLSSFAGPTCADEQMDHDQLLLAPYSQAQGDAQVNALPKEFGKQGLLAKNMIDAYVAGVNAWIANTQAHPSELDGDYIGTSTATPTDWTPADVVDVAGLIGGIFGRGGGIEVANSALYTYLQHKLGKKAGAEAFGEFKEQNDPSTPTTVVGKKFPYETMPKHVNTKLTAIPDHPLAALKGGPTDTTAGCSNSGQDLQVLKDIAALRSVPSDMSNALVVDAKDTKAHHPIAVFGPQVSYYSPQILTEEEISTPGYHAEGASFPGTGLVELGRGVDYAWSATSAGTDLIDQRLELVCDPDGKTPTATEKYYRYKGKCVAMKHETFDETGYTGTLKSGTAVPINHDIYLTRHGVVQGWTTADGGKPVAVVDQRSTFNHDVDSVVGFLHWGEPKLTRGVKGWEAGAHDVGYTFNWFYADSKHIAYYVSGKDPIRAKHADPNLPTWGTGDAEWRGYLPASKHVHETDPKQGFFVSWNNKPAPAFSAADDQYGYGPSYRSQMLVAQLKHEMKVTHDKLTRADVVKAMETAASQDLTGLTVLPRLLTYVKGHKEPKGVTSMLKVLAAWHKAGAHRRKSWAGAKQYEDHAAIAIMDQLEPRLIESVFNRLLAGPGLDGPGTAKGGFNPTSGGYRILPMGFVDTPNGNGSKHGSSYDGGWEGYMEKVLEQLDGKHPVDPFTHVVTKKWCTSGPASCRGAINRALLATYQTLKKENGSAKVSSWTVDSALLADRTATGQKKETMPEYDAIEFAPFGLIGQPQINWQNRPTFQQVIQFPAHRKV